MERIGPGRLAVVALFGLVVGLAAAFVPLSQDVDRWEYIPDTPGEAVAPLALARGTADGLSLDLPCEAADSRFSTTPPPELLERPGSLRFPGLGGGLSVRVTDGAVLVDVGSDVVLEAGVEPSAGCLAEVRFFGDRWSIRVQGSTTDAKGPAPRVAEARFAGSAADHPASRVVVETRELGGSPTVPKLALALLSLALVAVAVQRLVALLPSRSRSPRPRPRLVDVVVVAVLGMWAVLIPPNLDDGWVFARVLSYDAHGDFSGIYTSTAVMPFGYWLEWLQHLWFRPGMAPLLTRLPALLAGVATWAAIRAVATRLGMPGRGGSVWGLGAAFVLWFGAWGMTLRPEPLLGLLTVLSLWCALTVLEAWSGRSLALWAGVIALGLSAHPAGVVVLAPVLVALPAMVRWVRVESARLKLVGAWLAVVGASLALVWFVDADVGLRLESIDGARSAHSELIAEEIGRYRFLEEAPYGTPMRRASIAVAFVGLAAFLMRKRVRDDPADLVAWSLLVGGLLLTLTPSKWPWHVGALVGPGSIVVVHEVRRMRRARWALGLIGVAAAASWTWSVSESWTSFDLRTHAWTVVDPITEAVSTTTDVIPFEPVSIVGWVLLGAALATMSLGLMRFRPDLHPPNPPEALGFVVVLMVVALTATTLWSDALATPGWTFGGQNGQALVGEADCGLGEEISIPAPGSLSALSADGESHPDADLAARTQGFSERGEFASPGYLELGLNATLPAPGAEPVGSWLLEGPMAFGANTGKYRSSWLRLDPDHDRVAVFLLGSYRTGGDPELGNAVGVQWGTASDGGVIDAGVDRAVLEGFYIDWFLVTFPRPDGADRVRLLLRDDTIENRESWVAATLPMGTTTRSFEQISAGGSADVLVTPPLAPYLPCVVPPEFDRTVIRAPGVIVQTWKEVWQDAYVAAMAGDRWFWYPVEAEPPLESEQIGAHTGDVRNFLFVSQQHLTGQSMRFTDEFARLDG